MANSLLEAIQSNMQKPVQTQAGDTLSQTAQAQSILSTKATGKTQPTGQGLPQGSNIVEQATQQQSQAQAREQSKAGSMAASQLGQAAEQQSKDIDYAERELSQQQLEASNRLMAQTGKVLDSYSQGLRELDYNKDKARLEQVGFGLRLSNAQYIDKLTREGRKARLDSEIGFKEALQASIFEDEEELLNSDLEFRRLMNADDREFQTILAHMDIQSAIDLANSRARAANEQAKYTGFGQILQGGIAGAKAYADTSSVDEVDVGAGATLSEPTQQTRYYTPAPAMPTQQTRYYTPPD